MSFSYLVSFTHELGLLTQIGPLSDLLIRLHYLFSSWPAVFGTWENFPWILETKTKERQVSFNKPQYFMRWFRCWDSMRTKDEWCPTAHTTKWNIIVLSCSHGFLLSYHKYDLWRGAIESTPPYPMTFITPAQHSTNCRCDLYRALKIRVLGYRHSLMYEFGKDCDTTSINTPVLQAGLPVPEYSDVKKYYTVNTHWGQIDAPGL